MLEASLNDIGLVGEIVPVPDIDDPPNWVQHAEDFHGVFECKGKRKHSIFMLMMYICDFLGSCQFVAIQPCSRIRVDQCASDRWAIFDSSQS